MNIEACVDDYKRIYRPLSQVEKDFYSKQQTLSNVISVAANCRCSNGKKHTHQNRIPVSVLREAEQQLLAHQDTLKAAQDFATLHGRIDTLIGSIKGIGELAVYDIAYRIAAFLRFEPDQVYLHAGTREGAAALGFSGRLIEKHQLPAFAQLTAAEIEDCLCIYKDDLSGQGNSSALCSGETRVSACKPTKARSKRGC
ncbi:hypothetical protein SAMN04515647_0480 [Cohaesibacter sp. ES.047]|uniref:hypothetical protein n=1 Tax=Cohaesibacter sp. ES.047 TaxID=1798205 RepID=UPI000BB7E346|nr:hypothetical protein [Cohaesibacter sp. ES.047]SNY90317.1 hypothetical protein SAMN04515647_0480 [Cohaesibacter sp. ES.047]